MARFLSEGDVCRRVRDAGTRAQGGGRPEQTRGVQGAGRDRCKVRRDCRCRARAPLVVWLTRRPRGAVGRVRAHHGHDLYGPRERPEITPLRVGGDHRDRLTRVARHRRLIAAPAGQVGREMQRGAEHRRVPLYAPVGKHTLARGGGGGHVARERL
jgi:hypothetical protein